MIDATEIYTAKRAQNIMTDEDIKKVFEYYQNYENVVEKCQIVDISELDDSLLPKIYIQKKDAKTIDPLSCESNYVSCYKEMTKNEQRMKSILLKGGFIDE